MVSEYRSENKNNVGSLLKMRKAMGINFSFWYFLLQIVEDNSLLSDKGIRLKEQAEREEIDLSIDEKIEVIKLLEN